MSLRSILAEAAVALRHESAFLAPKSLGSQRRCKPEEDASLDDASRDSFAKQVFADMQILDAYGSLSAFAHNARRSH